MYQASNWTRPRKVVVRLECSLQDRSQAYRRARELSDSVQDSSRSTSNIAANAVAVVLHSDWRPVHPGRYTDVSFERTRRCNSPRFAFSNIVTLRIPG